MAESLAMRVGSASHAEGHTGNRRPDQAVESLKLNELAAAFKTVQRPKSQAAKLLS